MPTTNSPSSKKTNRSFVCASAVVAFLAASVSLTSQAAEGRIVLEGSVSPQLSVRLHALRGAAVASDLGSDRVSVLLGSSDETVVTTLELRSNVKYALRATATDASGGAGLAGLSIDVGNLRASGGRVSPSAVANSTVSQHAMSDLSRGDATLVSGPAISTGGARNGNGNALLLDTFVSGTSAASPGHQVTITYSIVSP